MATTAPDRILTLDVIRGVAVMGIFSVNVVAFAMIEPAYFDPAVYGGASGANLLVWAANMIAIDGKMRSLFSMLFGASMLLVIERAERSGRSGWWTHFRRMAVLLGFGLAHYYFIWFGDILTLYAVCGLLVFRMHRLQSEQLLALGAAFLVTHMLVFGWILLDPGQSGDFIGSFHPDAQALASDRALHLGGYAQFVSSNLGNWGSVVGNTAPFIVETMGLMLIGMAGFKSGFLTGQRSDRLYRQVALRTLPIGALAGLATVAFDVASGFTPRGMLVAFIVAETPFITMMAAGYAAVVILLSRGDGALVARIAAAGRCAFTNYLGTSILSALVFYGWGLGLYGSLSRSQAWLLVPLVWAIMLLWSKPWLDRFNYGPFEWVWRTLSRGRLQPMRKRAPAS